MSEPRFTRRPVDGPITQAFGEAASGYPHRGVDFGVVIGTPVYAPCAGKVVQFTNSFTQWNGEMVRSFGNGVCIEMGGGWWTLLAHLSQVVVNIGDTVKAGQIVGYSGNTGVSTGPHLHWQLCDSPAFPIDINQSRDPLAYIVAGEEDEPMTKTEKGLLNIAWGDFGRALDCYHALRGPNSTDAIRGLLPDEGIDDAFANGCADDDLNAAMVLRGRLTTIVTSDVAEDAYRILGGQP